VTENDMQRNGGRLLAILALVPACDTPFGFGGQELEIDGAAEASAPMGEFDSANDTCTEGTVDAALSATGGSGTLDVTHAFDGDCCAEWVPSAVVSETEEWVIDLAYTNDAAACDCTCGFTLEYTLQDVPAGDWTIRADGLEASATVQ
jgi:hypothetical protein